MRVIDCVLSLPGRNGPALLVLSLVLSAGAVAAPAAHAADNEDPHTASTISRGYQRYQGVCGHCHGPDGLGSAFAPSLIDRPIGYKEFRDVALNGRAEGAFVMPGYAADSNVAPYLDAIYSYLKARHEGLGRGRPPAP